MLDPVSYLKLPENTRFDRKARLLAGQISQRQQTSNAEGVAGISEWRISKQRYLQQPLDLRG